MTKKQNNDQATSEKNPSQQAMNAVQQSSTLTPSSKEVGGIARRKGCLGILKEFLIITVAHLFVPQVVAIASVVWLFLLKKDSTVPFGVFILMAVVFIIASYLILISIHYFFEKDFYIARRWGLHGALLSVVAMVVIVPVAIMQAYSTSRINQILIEKQKVEEDRERLDKAKDTADANRLALNGEVRKLLEQILPKGRIEGQDLTDLLHRCLDAINVNNPRAIELRASVAYLDSTKQHLVIPKFGFFGAALFGTIAGQYFELSPPKPGESEDDYLKRLGVAGSCFLKGQNILEPDVQEPGGDYRYKLLPGQPVDRAMICVLIRDLRESGKNGSIGVLSISSLSPDVLTKNDQAVAEIYATLLGTFPIQVDGSRL